MLMWERMKIIPPDLLRHKGEVIEARAEDGGRLVATVTQQHGTRCVQINYIAMACSCTDGDAEPLPKCGGCGGNGWVGDRFPTVEELLSALHQVAPMGAVMQLQLANQQLFPAPEKMLMVIQVGRLAEMPQPGNGKDGQSDAG